MSATSDFDVKPADGATKKPLSELSQEELVQKCRGLLQIAQKAKQAKDDAFKELQEAKAEADEVPALREMVSSLTEQTLTQATAVDSANGRATASEQELGLLRSRLSDLETENEGKSRQVRRLTEENDEVLTRLDDMEEKLTLAMGQRDSLESEMATLKTEKESCLSDTSKLRTELDLTHEKMERLTSELEKANEAVEIREETEALRQRNDSLEGRLSSLEEENAVLHEKVEKLAQENNLAQEELTRSREAAKSLDEQREMLEKRLNEQQSIAKETNSDLQENVIEIAELKQLLQDSHKSQEELTSRLNLEQNATADLKQFKSKYEELLAEVEADKDEKDAEIHKLRLDVEEANRECEKTLEEKEFLTETNEHLQRELKTKGEGTIKLDQEMRALREALRAAEEEKNTLALKAEKTQEQLREKLETEKTLKDSLKDANAKLEASERTPGTAEDLDKENEKSTQKVDTESDQLIRLKQAHEEEMKALRKKEKDALEKANNLKASLEAEVDRLVSGKNQLEEDKKKLQDGLAELEISQEETLTNFKRVVVEKEGLEESLKQTQSELDKLASSLEEERATVAVMKTDIKQLEATRAADVSRLEKIISEREWQLQVVTNEYKDYKEDSAVTLRSSEMKMKSLVASKEAESNKFKEELRVAQEVNLKRSDSLSSALDRVRGLRADFIAFQESVKSLVCDHQRDMLRYMEDQEMSFVLLKQGLVKELAGSEGRNTDLIDEMNQMNKEIKRRGERISVLEEKQASLLADLEKKAEALEKAKAGEETMKSEVSKLKAAQKTLETDLDNEGKKEKEIEQELFRTREELDKLKKVLTETEERLQKTAGEDTAKTANDSQQQPSEAMSTSTISKAEESNRMADVESSFEERYAKLKAVAIKLKRKTSEQEKKIKEQESRIEELEQTEGNSINREKRLATLMSNFESLQKQNDEQGDIIEEQKKAALIMKKDLQAAEEDKTELANVRGELSKVKDVLHRAEDERDSLIKELSEHRVVAEKERKELLNVRASKETLETSYSELSHRLSSLEGAGERHDLLDMELETAEHRIEELSAQITEAEKKLTKAEEEIEHERALKAKAEEAVRDLEQSLQREQDRAEEFKSKLSDARSQVSQLESRSSQLRGELHSLQQRLERVASEKERINCQLAEVSGSAANTANAFSKRNEALEKMVNLLETELGRRKAQTAETEEKLSRLEKEYEGYKVRAQSVLRQAKDADTQLGDKAQEVTSLERTVQALNEKLLNVNTQLAAGELEFRHLQEDHDRLMSRHSVLLQEMASKELASRQRQEQLTELVSQAEKSRQDALAQAQEQLESVKQAYRSQLRDLQTSHSGELARLHKQIDEQDNKIIRMEMAKAQSPTCPSGLNVNLIEREAAEGSETIAEASNNMSRQTSVSPAASALPPKGSSSYHYGHRRGHSTASSGGAAATPSSPPIITLEKLLSPGSMDEDTLGEEGFNVGAAATDRRKEASASLLNDDAVAELADRTRAFERRVAHLSALLSESESENSRLAQLAEVLKEEIRTYQRAEERKKHIDNLEYVKNIILKFLTLRGSDERVRLIPVLTTILKLSPAEVETVQKAINADADENAVQEVGWSTYLGLWSQ